MCNRVLILHIQCLTPGSPSQRPVSPHSLLPLDHGIPAMLSLYQMMKHGMRLSLVFHCHLWHHQTRQPPPFVDSWVPSSTSILDLPAHLLVKLRPDELEHIASEITTMKDVVQQNYNWAFSAYSAQNPIHKLAFIISSVMFRMAPSYMVATKSAPRNQPPPWTSTRSSTRRPLPSGPICFGLWLVYLLTMLDSSSPLRSSLQTPMAGRRVVLGADWVDSMSKSFS